MASAGFSAITDRGVQHAIRSPMAVWPSYDALFPMGAGYALLTSPSLTLTSSVCLQTEPLSVELATILRPLLPKLVALRLPPQVTFGRWAQIEVSMILL